MSIQDEYSAEESDLYEGRQRGEMAKALLDNPLWSEAFDHQEQALMEWLRHGTDEQSSEAKQSLHLLDGLKRRLEHHVNTGTMAENRLNFIAQARDKLSRLFAAA